MDDPMSQFHWKRWMLNKWVGAIWDSLYLTRKFKIKASEWYRFEESWNRSKEYTSFLFLNYKTIPKLQVLLWELFLLNIRILFDLRESSDSVINNNTRSRDLNMIIYFCLYRWSSIFNYNWRFCCKLWQIWFYNNFYGG